MMSLRTTIAFPTHRFIPSSTPVTSATCGSGFRIISALLTLLFPLVLFGQTWPEAPEKWGMPVKIPIIDGNGVSQLNSSLTADGQTMYIGRGNLIYVSSKRDTGWTAPTALNDSINELGTLSESPSISPDGTVLYFRRYVGQWRILQSRWNENLQLWGTPTDMGIGINEFGAWFGMTPDDIHFYFHRTSLPRVSMWSDTSQSWGPSEWVDLSRFLACYQGISVTPNLRKIYYDEYVTDINIMVHYYDTTTNRWSNPMALNLNRLMDTLPTAQGTFQMYPWISADKKLLYFTSDHDGALGLWVSRLLIDENGDTVISDVRGEVTPFQYRLDQNFPNPFNPSTTITYSIAKQSRVALRVFDVLGRELSTLVDGVQPVGIYSVQFNAAHLSSGVYFYLISTPEFVASRKMILTK